MMAYQRRKPSHASNWSTSTSFSSTTTSDLQEEEDEDEEHHLYIHTSISSNSSSSLAARAIGASSAAYSHRDSSLSSAYGFTHCSLSSSSTTTTATTSAAASSSSSSVATTTAASTSTASSKNNRYTSINAANESKQGFWGSLARKAKSFLDDDYPQQQTTATLPKNRKTDAPPTLRKGFSAISSSLNYIGNAVEEGLSKVENRTADIIQETRKNIRKNPNQPKNHTSTLQQPQIHTQMETDAQLQLKASRDVAMAMAAKAKLLLRELKSVKADLAFAKERCGQLEEENKILREHCERGDSPEDDDLVRLQLETLLAEKARLTHENSAYTRENHFLREVVEYHQLTMQDVVYLNEGTEEVSEVYPINAVSNTHSTRPILPHPSLPTEASLDTSLQLFMSTRPVPPPGVMEFSENASSPG